MKSKKSLYKRRRHSAEIIQHAVWLYDRFALSYRAIEDLLAERGVQVSCEAIRLWCNKFGPRYGTILECKSRRSGNAILAGKFVAPTRGQQ